MFYGFVDFVGEEVGSDYGEVAHGRFGFLYEFDYVAFVVDLGYAESGWVVDFFENYEGVQVFLFGIFGRSFLCLAL